MSWGSHALVLEPGSLRSELKAEAEKVSEKYTKPVELEHKEKPLMG